METEAPFLRWAQRVETALGQALPSASIPPQRLHAAMRHAVLGGGKRIGKVEDVVNVGDKLQVEIQEIDQRGKISLVPVSNDAPEPAAAE